MTRPGRTAKQERSDLWVGLIAVAIVIAIIILIIRALVGLFSGGIDGVEGNGGGLDFGTCSRINGSDLQTCTYSDGHTEVLNLSDGTGR